MLDGTPPRFPGSLRDVFSSLRRRAKFKLEVLGIEQCLLAKRADMALHRARELLRNNPDIHSARLAGCIASGFVLIASRLKPEDVLLAFDRFEEDGFAANVELYGLGYHLRWALCQALLRVLPQPAFAESIEMLISFLEQDHKLIDTMCTNRPLALELLGYAATRNGKTGFVGPSPHYVNWNRGTVCAALKRSLL